MTKKQAKSLVLDLENEGKVEYDIGGRGGTYGIPSHVLLDAMGLDVDYYDCYLPRKIGAYVNYLGGGIRGSILGSTYSENLPRKIALDLERIIDACKQRYEELENETGLNTEESDGEINWEAEATKQARKNGIASYPGL